MVSNIFSNLWYFKIFPIPSLGVVTGSGQTYVVVQEGDNISFVPAEMVQGDLGAAVNGGQVSQTYLYIYCISLYLTHSHWGLFWPNAASAC